MEKFSNSSLSKKTRRLEVRPFNSSDFKSWKEGCLGRLENHKLKEFELSRPKEKNLTRKKFGAWIKWSREARKKDLCFNFGFFRKSDGAWLGKSTIFIFSRGEYQFANLGYSLNNQFYKNGYAEEGIRAVCDIAFRVIKLHRLEAGIDKKNEASIKLVRKLRFHNEGVRKQFFYDGKKWRSLELYSLMSEDFGYKNVPLVKPTTNDILNCIK